MKNRTKRARCTRVTNARRSLARMDPSRTLTLRRALSAELRKRFALLKGRLVKLLVDDDALGLKEVRHTFPLINTENLVVANLLDDPRTLSWEERHPELVVNSNPDQPRDEQGRFTSGGSGVAKTSTGIHKRALSAIKGLREKVGGKFTEYVDKIPGGKALRTKFSSLKDGMEARYGKNTMKLIVGGAQAISWGAFGIGAAIGMPNYIPASGLMAVGAVLAEGYLQVSKAARLVKGLVGNEEDEKFDHDIIDREAKTLFESLVRDWALVSNAFDPDQPRDDKGQWSSGGSSTSREAPKVGTIEHLRAIVGAAKSLYPDDPKSGVEMVRKMGYPNMQEANYKVGFGEKVTPRSVPEEKPSAPTPSPAGRLGGAGMPGPASSTSTGTSPAASVKDVASHIARLADASRYNHVAMADLHEALGRPPLEQFKETVKGLWHKGAISMSEDEGRATFQLPQAERDRITATSINVPSSRTHGSGSNMSHLSVIDRAALTRLANNLLTTNAPPRPAPPQQWRYASDPRKVAEFKRWLRSQLDRTLRSNNERDLLRTYAERGFRQGAGRAFDDSRAAERALAGAGNKLDFYAGTREEFLRSSFGRPVAVEKVELLAGRSFDDLENVTNDMSTRMTRTLTDGLVEGKGPREIAKDLSDEVDIGRARAETIARTEIVRAHAEGQLTALEQMGVEKVGVAVEWSTTGDDKVCDECQPLEGAVLTIEEARGMLPRHPNCRCAWVPANVGEDAEDQKRSKEELDSALGESGLDIEVSTSRPESTMNVFCPTGEGGGVDATCSPGESAGSKFVGEKVGKAEHVHADKVEKSIATALDHEHEEDRAFYDTKSKDGKDFVEVKSLLKGSKTSISVHPDALLRKVDGMAANPGANYHTVVSDEREVYQDGAHKDKYSGNRLYYKRGSGRYSLSKMHPVKDMKELKELMKTTDDQLPEKARGSLPTGKALKGLRKQAEAAHAKRLAKDRARKERLKAEGKSAYKRQT